jgi:mannose-6-phosphate isomerase-like protein (cupin superfamily)
MGDAHVVNIGDRPDIEAIIERPGTGAVPGTERKSTRYLGLDDDNPMDPQKPPFAFYIRRPAGDVTPEHSHQANRVEFVIEGRIEWRERGKEPVEYGAGTLTYVEAGTVYGYTVLEDATILILFETAPRVSKYSADQNRL